MPRRQLLAFRIGCWAAFATAALHLVGHFQGPMPPETPDQETLLRLLTTVTFALPGASERTTMELMNGFSLSFSVLLGLTGAIGLIVLKRGTGDPTLFYAVARALAGGSAVLLVISLSYWFLIPSVCIAMMAISFAVSAVKGS